MQQGLNPWYNNYKKISNMDLYAIVEHLKKLSYKPKISIITTVYNTKIEWFKKCVESVKSQVYTNWEWCICDNGSTNEPLLEYLDLIKKDERIIVQRVEDNQGIVGGSNIAIEMATGDYSILIDSDDLLPELTLYYILDAVNTNRDIRFFYTDEVFMDGAGDYIDVFFKPDWSPDFLRSRNYIDHLKGFDTALIKELKLKEGFDGSHDYDLLLRAGEACTKEQIHHIPAVGYVWRQSNNSHSRSDVSIPIAGAIRALEQHLERVGVKGKVMWEWPWYRVKYEVPEPAPRVGILVPSANLNNMLFTYINNIIRKTTYPNYCVYLCIPPSVKALVERVYRFFVENGTLKFVDRGETEEYNFSTFNNRMVEACEEELIVQMNDDVEPLTDDWLHELVGIGIQPHVGAVGARLLYPNMNVQHVGCALGIFGVCEHLFKNSHYSGLGYHGKARLISNVSMVTAACVLTKKSVYQQVGGYDENLAVAFNDVDFCIKVTKAGYFNVINPYSLLIHYESQTRGLDNTQEKKDLCAKEGRYMINKWGSYLQKDPFYNPNLTLVGTAMEIEHKSRFVKPWTR